MSTIADISRSQESLEALITRKMADFESKLNSSASKSSNVDRISEDYTAFQSYVKDMFNLLRQQIAEVSRSLDIIETRHRRKFLLMGGVPEKPGEDLSDVVIKIFHENLGLKDIAPSCLRAAYRLGPVKLHHTRPILMRFTDMSLRSTVWFKKTMLKGTSFKLSEFLTKYRQDLFLQARKHFGIKKVWSFEGNISVRLPDGSRRHIFSANDLDALLRDLHKAGCNEEPEQVKAGISSVVSRSEQPRTRRALRNK